MTPVRCHAFAQIFAATLLLGVAPGCRTGDSAVKEATADAEAVPAGACRGGKILVVTSSAAVLTLRDGSKYPTGVFLRELTDPLIEFIREGCRLEFATPTGEPMTVDSNSLELLWAYYPYSELKPDAAKHREEAVELATTVYGRLRFSQERPQWPRLTQEVQNYVAAVRARQADMPEKSVRRISDVVAQIDVWRRSTEPFPYVGMFVPGGHVPMEDLVVDADFGRLLNAFHDGRVPTGLICHAPVALLATKQVGTMTYAGYRVAVAERMGEQMLEQIGPLQGYRVKSYVDDDLEKNGVILNQTPWPGYPQVVADRELLTGQNPASAPFLGIAFMESVAHYLAKGGVRGWWEQRSQYLTHPSLRDDQAKIIAKAKVVADRVVAVNEAWQWKRQYYFNLLGIEAPAAAGAARGNIFLNPTYVAAFDLSMVTAERLSVRRLYPEAGAPKVLLNKFPVPILDFNATLNPFRVVDRLYNYFYVFPASFYRYDIANLNQRLGEQLH